LVTQRGIQLMGVAAFGILVVTGGRVALLVVRHAQSGASQPVAGLLLRRITVRSGG